MEETRTQILEMISDEPNITTAEPAERIGITRKGIEWQITRLKKEGLLNALARQKAVIGKLCKEIFKEQA